MGDGLKDQWGVSDPAKAGSDQQSQEFQASFQTEITAISGHLQYTATNAEAARHDPLAARRDALYPAFQSALGQIDPANPAKAQGAIDKVLPDAKALNGEANKLRTEAEKAFNDWQPRQPKLDTAVQNVEELEVWGDAKATPLRMLVDGVRKETDKRRYAPASTTLDQLLPKLQQIYAEYLKQKEAKEKYEPAAAALQSRLSEAAQSRYTKLAPMQQDIVTVQTQMETAAQSKNFVQALDLVAGVSAKLDAYEKALAELEQHKKEYEAALAALQPKLDKAGQPTQSAKLLPMQQEITTLKGQMESAATGEDYEGALKQANDLTTKVDAYDTAVTELAAQKKAYEEALTALQPKLDKAGQPTQSAKLLPMQQEITTLKGQMESAATGEDYEGALKQATDLTTKVDAYDTAVTELEAQKKAYEEALTALQPKLDKAGQPTQSAKLLPMQQEITTLKGQMESAATGEDYEGALKQATDLTAKVDAYDTAVTELEAQKKAYEEALTALQPKLDKAGQPTQSPKLLPMQQEITTLKGQMESAATGEDYEGALKQATDLTTKVDAYDTAVTELEAQKKAYEEALAALQPKLDKAGQPTQSPKLLPMQQEITTLKGQMESAATSEDYEGALKQATDLTTKVDAYDTAVTELAAQKKAYEEALTALQPKLDKAGQPTQSAKLLPMQQEITTLKGQMESAATGEDYEGALKQATDLTAKVDAYDTAVTELEAKKKEYEEKLAALQPRLTKASESKYAKLEPQQKEIADVQKAMEETATGDDYEGALTKATDLETKLGAFETALAELEAKKKEYEEKLAALQPRLTKASESKYAKLEPQQKEIADAQKAMEDTATGGDYEGALAKATELETKLTAFETALAELEAKKKEYEDKLAALQPRLTKASESKYAKLEPMQKEIADAQKAMEDTATGGDYEGALTKATDLETKLGTFETALAELEAKKKDYEDKLAALQPRLTKASESKYAKLEPQQKEIADAQKAMEDTATGGDYEGALTKATDLETKLGTFETALAELEAKKKEYEDKLAALQPRLAKAIEPKDGKLTPPQEEIVALKKQMEAAAQSADYEQALKLANDLLAKLDALAKEPGPSGGSGGGAGGGGAGGAGDAGGTTPADGGGDSGGGIDKVALTFDVGPVEAEFGKWGKTSNFTGSFKIKAKGKGELVTKGSGKKVSVGSSTDGGHKAEVELGVQKAKELGSETWKKIFKTLKIKETKETFKDDLNNKKIEIAVEFKATFESSVPWLSPIASGKFVIAGAEWEKIKKDPFAFTVGGIEISGGVEAKGPIPLESESFDANLSVEVTGGGSAKLNWPVIMAKMLEKYGERVLLNVAGDAAIAGGGAAGGGAAAGGGGAATGGGAAGGGAAGGGAAGGGATGGGAAGGVDVVVQAGAFLDVAIPAALAAVAIGTVAGVADAFVQRSQNKDMRVGINTAHASLFGGLEAGLSGAASAGGDELYQKGFAIGHQAYTAAIAKLMQQPNLPPPDDITAAARDAAKKAAKKWNGANEIYKEIQWAFFREWVANNHGKTTFKGAAQDAVLSCFGIGNEPSNGPHMSYWVEKSTLPDFMKS